MKRRKVYLIVLLQDEGINEVLSFKSAKNRDLYFSKMRMHGNLRAYKRDEELIDTYFWLENLLYKVSKKLYNRLISSY